MKTEKTKQLKLIYLLLVAVLFFTACSDDNNDPVDPTPDPETKELISAMDLSQLPEIELTNPTFFDLENNAKDFLDIVKENGVNTVRLRLWVNPENEHSAFNEVKTFSGKLKAKGFDIWLTVHYSDTWADPGQQNKPERWSSISYSALKDSVYSYTQKIITEIAPDYIQIGNEINSGFLHPEGNIQDQTFQFLELMEQGIRAVRDNSSATKIIIHYAGLNNADWFFNVVRNLDYDMIGLSYYPIWHGKSLTSLKTTLTNLSQTFNKEIVLAETAYPFTLGWNDWTNNIVGQDDQLIRPDYPATETGQQQFIERIKQISFEEVEKGRGFCYWGAELIAWKGPEAPDASPWENQAVFDFNNKALPVLSVFGEE
ncbi:arabinogalactan endo-1,4-beta-galactosidase [Draconibacterium orientale]|uniref:Arabinogalactan endo-beta-1,4-galactanase n=1 Tax=Draconibacterium orientale TaxID=1168034 RepID=X5DDD5_9BACT|nr:glycosyl hydrolase 53 family protein [Draconibacterium orientale]AHW59004.1 arabinogalactan endo-1 4-beta-galactosidase [Draconibacterium orientale]SEU16166.1 arabinogalactan endo-1,4-beta-galactosidase [Draconibacterium orientale]